MRSVSIHFLHCILEWCTIFYSLFHNPNKSDDRFCLHSAEWQNYIPNKNAADTNLSIQNEKQNQCKWKKVLTEHSFGSLHVSWAVFSCGSVYKDSEFGSSSLIEETTEDNNNNSKDVWKMSSQYFEAISAILSWRLLFVRLYIKL